MPESYKENGRPAQQWYWDDWFSAFDVRLCSLAARGLWIDMLGIMFKAEIRGTLTVNGKKIHSKTIAKITGASVANVERLLKELERHDVFSRLEDDTIICRRMFRESGKKDQISKIRSDVGKKGAEKRWQKMASMATPSASPSASPTAISSSKKEGGKIIISTKQEEQIYKELTTVKGLGDKKIASIMQYLRELSIEFPEIDYVDEMKKKVAWWIDNPLTKNSNVHLQIRNWFIIAQKGIDEAKRQHSVGVPKSTRATKYPMIFLNNVYKILRKQGKDNNNYSELLFTLTDAQAKVAAKKYKDTPADFIKFLEAKK